MVGGYGGCLWAGNVERPDLPGLMQQANEQVVREFIEEVWNRHNLAAYDQYVTACYCRKVDHRIVCGSLARQLFSEYISGCPSLHIDIDEVMTDEDLVLTRLTVSGTDLSGNAFQFPTTAVYRLVLDTAGKRKIEKSWHLLAEDRLLSQIGASAVEAMQQQAQGQ